VLGAAPLAGIRVIEIGNYMAGPFCGMQLVDLGADVVKVEHPKSGDLARLLEPLASGESGNFARLNRDKPIKPDAVGFRLPRNVGQPVGQRDLNARNDGARRVGHRARDEAPNQLGVKV